MPPVPARGCPLFGSEAHMQCKTACPLHDLQIQRSRFVAAGRTEPKPASLLSVGMMRLAHTYFRPPAPVPWLQTPRLIELIRTLWRNPIEAWTQAHFEQPVVQTRLPFCDVIAVSAAPAVRHVLSDNAKNYCKDWFQKRMLAVLTHGLLTAEGRRWRFQRRLMIPLFRPASVKGMARAMAGVVDDVVNRWSARDGSVIDIAEETTDLALRVLEATIFSA